MWRITILIVSLPLTLQAQNHSFSRMLVDSLASETFGGRGYDDEGDDQAAAFIASQFEELGLEPLFEDYFQTFPLEVDVFSSAPELSVDGQRLRLGLDFLPAPGSISGEGKRVRKIVEAGAGLYLPDQKVNEYDGLDVRDAVVLIRGSVPDSIRKTAPADWLLRSTRIEIAARMGARAVIVLTENPLSFGWGRINSTIPAFIVRDSVLTKRPSIIDYAVESQLDWPTTTKNVAGVIRGAELPDEYIFVTAHYDHLGRMGPDVFFPGANDNASGTAMIVELARSFARRPLRRSLVFIGFSGEEQGLRGSNYFVENTPVPLDSIHFLLNLDMVASAEDGRVAVGGADFDEEFELLTAINDSLDIGRLGKRKNAPNSDHYPFLQNGVRGFFIYTNKGKQPYHHPYDVIDSLEWDDYADTFELARRFLIEIDRL